MSGMTASGRRAFVKAAGLSVNPETRGIQRVGALITLDWLRERGDRR